MKPQVLRSWPEKGMWNEFNSGGKNTLEKVNDLVLNVWSNKSLNKKILPGFPVSEVRYFHKWPLI